MEKEKTKIEKRPPSWIDAFKATFVGLIFLYPLCLVSSVMVSAEMHARVFGSFRSGDFYEFLYFIFFPFYHIVPPLMIGLVYTGLLVAVSFLTNTVTKKKISDVYLYHHFIAWIIVSLWAVFGLDNGFALRHHNYQVVATMMIFSAVSCGFFAVAMKPLSSLCTRRFLIIGVSSVTIVPYLLLLIPLLFSR